MKITTWDKFVIYTTRVVKINRNKNKTYKNSPFGRSKIPESSGYYYLLDKNGKILKEGYSNNLNKAIKEKHYYKSTIFNYIKVRMDLQNGK